MDHGIGEPYTPDDPFRAAARRHQSLYRSKVLGVAYSSKHGNMLTDHDAQSLMNYYGGLNIRVEKEKRYPRYSRERDANMLRSEHIPFNMLAPLKVDSELAAHVIEHAFGLMLVPPFTLEIEWAPSPIDDYLGDHTAFDTYIEGRNPHGRKVGLGIEVKYTERGYRIRETEEQRVSDENSTYWTVTRRSGRFRDSSDASLADDDVRQLWRNHLLGLSMCQKGLIEDFVSIVLYPAGNIHMASSVRKYQSLLVEENVGGFIGRTFETFIDAIDGGEEILRWKSYLRDRYLVT